MRADRGSLSLTAAAALSMGWLVVVSMVGLAGLKLAMGRAMVSADVTVMVLATASAAALATALAMGGH